MFMVNPEEYNSMKGRGEPDDVKALQFDDAFKRKSDIEKIKQDEQWKQLSDRLKPIFGTNTQSNEEELKDIASKFPQNEQGLALSIAKLLLQLPKVTIVKNELLIGGVTQPGSVVEIIDDMIENGVKDMPSLIKKLREGRKRSSTSSSFKSFISDGRSYKSPAPSPSFGATPKLPSTVPKPKRSTYKGKPAKGEYRKRYETTSPQSKEEIIALSSGPRTRKRVKNDPKGKLWWLNF